MTLESQPLVSVLTPVYNGEEYLAECIESVLAQTYQNWDYCIVNNCSTDRTLEIAETYAKKDKRIRIHNNSNFVGCDENGNIAFLQISSGSKYCKVVHADDWLFPECILRMVELAEANPTVGIVSSYRLTNTRIMVQALSYRRTVIPGREICRSSLLDKQSYFGSPTSMLIHSDEVRKRPAFYNVANPHCDYEACLDILRDRDFGFVHQMLTFSREHAEAESTFVYRMGSNYLSRIEHLTKYGRIYLSEEELNICFKRSWAQYYAFLASKLLRSSDNELWKFHTEGLARLGYKLSFLKCASSVVAKLLDLILNPLQTSHKIFSKIAK